MSVTRKARLAAPFLNGSKQRHSLLAAVPPLQYSYFSLLIPVVRQHLRSSASAGPVGTRPPRAAVAPADMPLPLPHLTMAARNLS